MNAADLKGMKRLMEIINLNNNRVCPICEMSFSETGNSMPVWSSTFDNIVCSDCNATVTKDNECGLA